ncbi:MAG: hypothetical protein MMC23_004264 [Stictis urceolatum]|nr:hypothetical protein [Stictis urceolata]
MAFRATRALKAAAPDQIQVTKKYTVQSTGIWERIRRALAVAPERSNGVPLNHQFRNPTPGGNDPRMYDDPVTIPAGDIADNPYWKRDVRRSYPKLSVVNQSDAVGLLTVGSEAAPKELASGEQGKEQLAVVKRDGEEKGLAGFFEKGGMVVLGKDGLPPTPSGLRVGVVTGEKKYVMNGEDVQSYPEEYPCRTFV